MSIPNQSKINIITDVHPDGHSQNGTTSCLEDVTVTVSVNLSAVDCKGNQAQLSELLTKAFSSLEGVDEVSSIDIEMGTED